MTKEEQLVEQLALEKGVRMGICACLTNLVVEHAKVVGGDQSKALATIRAALDNTVPCHRSTSKLRTPLAPPSRFRTLYREA